MGIIVIQILTLISLWLIGCAGCVLVGFFLARELKDTDKKEKRAETEIEPISKEEELKRQREALEYFNMMTYDGTPQDPIDIK